MDMLHKRHGKDLKVVHGKKILTCVTLFKTTILHMRVMMNF